ncbi:MAG: SAM-dependent chlorinase/fluorinase [Xenococcaceae cyanobacterium MO_167.B27]|nr:SAM-dependent chlorinase/fluorinase [Xenococcaceae cyanobacterium MO_167.B27]
MFIHLIADYGTGDPAFAEVKQRLLKQLPSAQIHCLSVPSFSTLAMGFWIAQLGLNPGASSRLIYHNCAPRIDNAKARPDNEGEGLTYALLPDNVIVVGVLSGYSLSFIKDEAKQMHVVKVSRGGSQFRSRDLFPQAAAAIVNGDRSILGEVIKPNQIPDVPRDRVAWIDGYGNIKTTIPAHTINLEPYKKVTVKVGDVVNDATYSDGSFKVPSGTLAFAPGSSGWQRQDGKEIRWMELFLRGGNAAERFGRPKINQVISYTVN